MCVHEHTNITNDITSKSHKQTAKNIIINNIKNHYKNLITRYTNLIMVLILVLASDFMLVYLVYTI